MARQRPNRKKRCENVYIGRQRHGNHGDREYVIILHRCCWLIYVYRSLKTGDDVKFEEFVQYVLQEARQGQEHLDNHWRPQYSLCQPCHINYDFIGHYETLHEDAEHVLRQISRLSNNTDVKFPATDVDSRNRKRREFPWKFYEEISTKNLFLLLQLYKKDYEVFGYRIPDVVRRKLNIQPNFRS